MRSIHLRRALVLLAGLLALAAPARAQRDSEFMNEFRKLMKIHDLDAMAALMKKHQEAAVMTVRETAEMIAGGSNELLETEIHELDKAWRKAFDTQFVMEQYDYFAIRLTGAYRRQHEELSKAFHLKVQEYTKAEAAKDENAFPGLGLEFKDRFGDGFSQLGDHYRAAQSYRIYAACFDDALSTKNPDYKRACEGWGLYLKAREEAELFGKAYEEAKVRFEKLEYDGYGDPSKGPEARAAEKAASNTAYQPTPINATFALLPDIESIERPLYTGDANFQMWQAIGLGGVDSSGAFPALEASAKVLRKGANEAWVDADGDGNGDVEIPLTGKITPVEFTLGSGDSAKKWAFLACIGQQQDTYQGFRFNLAPDTNNMSLYIAPAASLVGTIDGVQVRVIDDNMDGIYGSPEPKGWAYAGLLEGSYQNDIDSIVVGEAKFARPWSRLQKIGDAWHQLAPNEAGTDIVANRADVESGTLKLDMKGVPIVWLVLRGTGNNTDLFYDVVNGGKDEVEVPVGTYELFAGMVASGKKQQKMKALVLPGKNSRSWSVKAGETTKMELGAPFDFDFEVDQDEGTVTVKGDTIHVVGRGGETYQRLWNCVLTPEVNMRKAGSSKGKKEKKLVPVGSQEELETQKYDYDTAWFPIGEPIEKPNPGETFEVNLFEKKHKLFGKIESDVWKAD